MRARPWILSLVVGGVFLVPVLAQDELAEGPAPPPGPLSPEEEGLLFPVEVIFTDLATDPSSVVPGLGGALFQAFDRPFGSPNGNWILSADTDLATTEDEIILVNGTLTAREGTAAPWTSGENVGLIDTKLGINDAGDWVFATNTDGPTTADDYVVSVVSGVFSAVAQEGQPGPVPSSFWGSSLDSGVIATDATVGLAGSLTGIPTTEDEALVLGGVVLGQQGVTIPPGQLGNEFWEFFDTDDYWISADGTHWLVQGDLTGDSATDDVVAVDGSVVVQEGVVLPGSGFAEPVDLSGIVGARMDWNGTWWVRGNNGVSEQDWIYRNGAVLAAVGDPVFQGAAEHWDDASFSDCFFFHVGNSSGYYVIGGVTDGPDEANGVLIFDGRFPLVRESDPIDVDGNGMYDDDAFFNTFGNDDGILTDGGIFYFVATIKDGSGEVIGDGFFRIDLSSIGTPIFEDGLESGDTDAWDTTVQ